MQNSHRQIISLPLLFIGIFTLLQLVVLAIFGYTPYPDSNGYIFLAEQCITEGDIYPITTKLNDYPFLWNIGAINAVVLSLKWFHSIKPLLILYCLMKGATAWFLYQVTRNIANDKIAIITLLLYVIYPANYGEGTSVLSELPFMFFNFLGIWLCISRGQYLLGGASVAVANWFRPMGIIFILSILIYLFFIKRKTIRPLMGYFAMILLIGSLSFQRTGLFLYQAKTGWMALTDYSTHHSTETMTVRENVQWNVSQKDSVWQSLFFEWVKEHPVDYVAQMPKKFTNTYISDNINMCTFIPNKSNEEYMYDVVSMPTLLHSFPNYSAVQILTLLNLLFYFALLFSALYSLIYFRKDIFLLPLCSIGLGTLLLLLIGHGEARFHIPLMPFVIILSAYFINKKIWKE